VLLHSENGPICGEWLARVLVGDAGVSVTNAGVGIDLVQNGLDNRLQLAGIRTPFVIQTRTFGALCNVLTQQTLTATLLFDMNLDVVTTSSVNDGSVEMQSGPVSVVLTNASLSVTGNTTVDSLLSSLLNYFTGYISDAIEPELTAQLQEVEEEFLNTLLAQTLYLSGDGYGFDINLLSRIDDQSIVPAALTQTAYTQVFPSNALAPGVDEGAIVRPIAAAGFDARVEPLTYAISDNTINSALWALWYGGTFVFDDVLGIPGVRLNVIPRLPPIIMPGSTEDESVLGIGDLMVAVELDLTGGVIPGVDGSVSIEAFVSQYLTGTLGHSDARRERLTLAVLPDGKDTLVEFLSAALDGAPIENPDTAAAILAYAEALIDRATQVLLNDSLLSISLPPVRFDLSDPIGGGTVTSMELALQQVRDVAGGILVDFLLEAAGDTPAQDLEWLSTNHRWSADDFIQQNMPHVLAYREADADEDEAHRSYRTSVGDYRSSLNACASAGESNGKKLCLTNWEEPLDYGWYCGAGRPVEGFLDNPELDPVDFCCRLHDRNLFDQTLNAKSPLNACGFAMCLHKARASTPEIFDLMPNVERARVNMYNRAAILCGANADDPLEYAILQPIGDPEIGDEP
jgi:hypothetical protein